MSLMLGRNPREDAEWPSIEDLELKLAWLDSAIPTAGKRRDALTRERSRVSSLLGEGASSEPVKPEG
jgi:hypothetical protein